VNFVQPLRPVPDTGVVDNPTRVPEEQFELLPQSCAHTANISPAVTAIVAVQVVEFEQLDSELTLGAYTVALPRLLAIELQSYSELNPFTVDVSNNWQYNSFMPLTNPERIILPDVSNNAGMT
jgi:hypothetical protein